MSGSRRLAAYLLDMGADLNATDAKGRRPIDLAVSNSNIDCLKVCS